MPFMRTMYGCCDCDDHLCDDEIFDDCAESMQVQVEVDGFSNEAAGCSSCESVLNNTFLFPAFSGSISDATCCLTNVTSDSLGTTGVDCNSGQSTNVALQVVLDDIAGNQAIHFTIHLGNSFVTDSADSYVWSLEGAPAITALNTLCSGGTISVPFNFSCHRNGPNTGQPNVNCGFAGGIGGTCRSDTPGGGGINELRCSHDETTPVLISLV